MTMLLRHIGHLCLVVGMGVLLYALSLSILVVYYRAAARGDSTLPLLDPSHTPHDTVLPFASHPSIARPPSQYRPPHTSTIRRVRIPAVGIDAKVAPIGWEQHTVNGMSVATWNVADYVAGHHWGSANPGEGSNIVLSGHAGGYGMVFHNLFYVLPSDEIWLSSDICDILSNTPHNTIEYLYVVTDRRVVNEEGATPAQRADHARFIAPTPREMVTLVTCWPPEGRNRFSQRVIVRAMPYHERITLTTTPATSAAPLTWSIR